MNVDSHAYHRGGVEHGVDAGLGVVAHDETAELQVRGQETAGGVVPQLDFAVIVFEVRGHGSGTQVAPFADDGVAQEPVVRLVGEAEHHHVVQLAAHLAVGTQRGGSVDFGTHVDIGMLAGGKRCSYAAALHHLRVSAQIDGAVGHVEDGALGLGTGLDKDFGGAVGKTGVADDAVRGAERLAGASAGDEFEIGFETLAVEQENIVEMLDIPKFAGTFEGMGVAVLPEVGFTPAEGDDRLLVDERFAGIQNIDLSGQLLVGNQMAGYEKVVVGKVSRVFPGHVIGGEVGVVARQHAFPLFAYGEDTYAYVGDGPGKRQGQQFEMLLVDVEENDIFHNRL